MLPAAPGRPSVWAAQPGLRTEVGPPASSSTAGWGAGRWRYSGWQTHMDRELNIQMVVFKCFIFDTIKT